MCRRVHEEIEEFSIVKYRDQMVVQVNRFLNYEDVQISINGLLHQIRDKKQFNYLWFQKSRNLQICRISPVKRNRLKILPSFLKNKEEGKKLMTSGFFKCKIQFTKKKIKKNQVKRRRNGQMVDVLKTFVQRRSIQLKFNVVQM